jgi:very-short-patch-repair endonuclease
VADHEPRISPRDFARVQRRTQSAAEDALWDMLRDRRMGVKFRRQHPIPPFTADFACVEAGLVVETDGPSHAIAEQSAQDARRTAQLLEQGWRVLRVRDRDVLSDPAGVRRTLLATLNEPSPPAKGERAG